MRILNPAEEASWADLVAMLGGRQPSLGADAVSWSLDVSQKFTVKSLYNKMTQGNSLDIARGKCFKAACRRWITWPNATDQLMVLVQFAYYGRTRTMFSLAAF